MKQYRYNYRCSGAKPTCRSTWYSVRNLQLDFETCPELLMYPDIAALTCRQGIAKGTIMPTTHLHPQLNDCLLEGVINHSVTWKEQQAEKNGCADWSGSLLDASSISYVIVTVTNCKGHNLIGSVHVAFWVCFIERCVLYQHQTIALMLD